MGLLGRERFTFPLIYLVFFARLVVFVPLIAFDWLRPIMMIISAGVRFCIDFYVPVGCLIWWLRSIDSGGV